jgi:methyl-accepting chemotaxis protein
MHKLNLKAKLVLGFGSLLAILAAASVVAYNAVGKLTEGSRRADEFMTKVYLSSQIEASLEKQTTAARGFLLAGKEDLLKHDEEGKRQFAESMDQMRKLLITEEGLKRYQEISDRNTEFRQIVDREIQLRRAGKTQEAVALAFNPRTSETRNRLRQAIAGMVEYQSHMKDNVLKEQTDLQARVRFTVLLLAVAGLAMGLLVSTMIARSITRGLAGILAMIQEIAGNNLALEDLQVRSEDEVGKAATALNQMKNNLRGVIDLIAGTAAQVASASEELSSSATQQAKGGETQNDQAVQVATAMQEMAATVVSVSDSCNKAANAARDAAETARSGGGTVEETLTKMRAIAEAVSATGKKVEELGKSSDQIGRIVGVIDDIADQTNLLALNAAIEAARAGDQGRGFAVVADEVRKLAERTMAATKEIAATIKKIQQDTKLAVADMEAGTRQAGEGVSSTVKAGDSLRAIIRMSEQVGEMITEIATAATEQSSTTEQVNGNVDQIARLVRESAVASQQSATACQDLSNLALDLQSMVGRFRLKNGQPSARRYSEDSGLARPSPRLSKPASQRALSAAAH